MALNVGSIIKTILDADPEVSEYGLDVYSPYAPQGTPSPFIAFKLDRLEPTIVKGNGPKVNNYFYTINSVHDNKDFAFDIDQAVRDAIRANNSPTLQLSNMESILYLGSTTSYDETMPNLHIVSSQYKIRLTE